jgi:hypothetical protein
MHLNETGKATAVDAIKILNMLIEAIKAEIYLILPVVKAVIIAGIVPQ